MAWVPRRGSRLADCVIHSVPIVKDGTTQHALSEDCWCGPIVVVVDDPEMLGEVVETLQHNAEAE